MMREKRICESSSASWPLIEVCGARGSVPVLNASAVEERTGQKSVTGVTPGVTVQPPEVNQIGSPSGVENLSRTSSILSVCEVANCQCPL